MRKALWALLAANALLASACADDTAPPNPPDDNHPTDPTPPKGEPRERELRGGRLHDVALTGITSVDQADPAKLVGAVQADLRGRLGALAVGDFAETYRKVTTAPNGGRLAFVTMRQTIRGIPVDDTYMHIGVRYGQSGTKLVSSSYRVYDGANIDTVAAVAQDRAITLAAEGLRLRSATTPRKNELVIHKLNGRLQLAWSLRFPGTYKHAFVVASGAEKGRVYTIDDRVYETTGTVSGTFVTGGAPGGLGTPATGGLAHLNVNGTGASTVTDGAGAFAITVPNGTPLNATLSGSATQIFDQAGATLSTSAPAVDGGVTDLTLAGADEHALAQVTAYNFVTAVNQFVTANGIDLSLFPGAIPTNTNIPDFCNAYYTPGSPSVNFFASGGGCNNSAIDTVIAHEYGHFVDDMNGGIIDGGLSEGWGDLLSCLWAGIPEVGFDIFPGQSIRSCQNTYIYPPGGFDEVHNLGQAWAGFGWDARQGLIATLGATDGEALARALLLPSFGTNAPDIPAAVREVFLRDDDDGNLDNQTPHWDVLYQAAVNHGLVFAIDPDFEAPAPVTDLAVTNAQATQVAVQWTATGDDGYEGVASSYQLRWAPFAIDQTNFTAANLVPTGAPQPSGSLETAIISVPPESTIWIALVVVDEQFNTSTLSNVVSVVTPAGQVVWDEGFEGDTSGWTATGMWHVTTRRASEGAQSFWYGQEATGNYDNGAANSGDLTSPVIDLSLVTGPVLVIDEYLDVEFDPYDVAQVVITNVDDPSEISVYNKSTGFTGGFLPRTVPLQGFDGDRVTITFHFDTLDSILNSTEGWFVDHVRVIGSDSCAHGLCFTGVALDPTCSPVVQQVCAMDSFCCQIAWDQLCVNEAQQIGGFTCASCGNGVCEPGETPDTCPADCRPACAHELCEPGPVLDPACDSCAATVCTADAFCCNVFWDRVCVDEVETMCGLTCQGCTHDFCAVGDPLANDCDPCAANVCSFDPYCCSVAWDSRCVEEAADSCGLSCAVCSHGVCDQGNALEAGCDPCVGAVCAADPYCCNNTWDERCVTAAQDTCGLSCANFR